MLTIGQAAHLAGTTVRAVRHYHQTGLLPEPPRSPNGYRRYRGSDLSRLLQIRQLSELGLALADIRRLVDGSAEDRRAALETLREQIAGQERQFAERRERIEDLLAADGDPAIPTGFRAYVKTLEITGAPTGLVAVDAEIYRVSGTLIPPDQQREVEDAMAALGDDPDLVATIGAYMRRLDEIAMLPPDHPEINGLAQEFADFLRAQMPQLVATDDLETNPDMEWLIQDLLAERLTQTQVVAMRGVIEHLRTASEITAKRSDATPPS